MRSSSNRLFHVFVALALLVGAFGAQAGLAQDYRPSSLQAVDTRGATVHGVSETGLYIVQFDEPALASYSGGIADLAATSPQATGEARLNASSPAALAYINYLNQKQSEYTAVIERSLGRSMEVAYRYVGALNAVALRISHEEAQRVAALPGVAAVYGDSLRELETDVGPLHIGAGAVWSGNTGSGVATRGEGIVIGVIDSGINSQHPSFAATDGDGYTHTNPYGAGVYRGWCAANAGFCNEKLIGAYTFHPNGGSPEDTDGHGSHTASTAGGNAHTASFNVGVTPFNLDIQGVAPRANIVAYKVCDPSCPGTASIAAVNSAILTDQVDVLNFSISGSDNPWVDPVDLAFLDAYNAGIFVSASAGNTGPGASTVAKTGPWNAAVAASTINRVIAHTLDVTGPTTPPELQGLAAVPGEGTNIAADLTGPLRFNPANADGCAAFSAGYFTGSLALIQRGGCTFGVKVGNAAAAGATGVVVFNNVGGPPISMGDLTGTPPAFMLDLANGSALRDYMLANPAATVRINLTTTYLVDNNWEDIVAGFSSRGPSQYELLKPDYIAPGVNIFAAYSASGGDPVQYAFLQGTSMSSPHGAGAAALMKALFPTWSPAEIKSAMATTTVGGLFKEDGVTPADPFDVGSGLLDLSLASRVGLVFDETGSNYAAADPAIGGDPKTLNQPSVVNYSCVTTCSWTRTVTSVHGDPVTYTAAVFGPAGLNLSVTPNSFTINPGSTQVLQITANVSSLPVDQFAFGGLVLEPDVSGVADTTIPVVVRTASSNLPETVSVVTNLRTGSSEATGFLVGDEITDLTIEVGGLFAGQMTTQSLNQDPTNGNPYNNDGGTFFVNVTVPANTLRLVTEIIASEATDTDLIVGTGSTPSSGSTVCYPGTSSALEQCIIDNPSAGTWWVLVQNWQASASQPDEVTLAVGVITEGDQGNLTIDGPTTVGGGVEFDLLLNWAEPSMQSGEKWYGFFTLGTDAANPGNIGLVFVDLLFTGAPTASVATPLTRTQAADSVFTATLEIANIGEQPLTWMIFEETSAFPAGLPAAAGPSPAGVTIPGLTTESQTLPVAGASNRINSEVLWEQVVNGSNGIVSDYFIGSGAGAYSASDFVLAYPAQIDTIFAAGFDNTNTLASQPAINWAIYADASGSPAGHPEDGSGMTSAVWSYSAAPNAAGVDITGNNIALDLTVAGEDLFLMPGTYWLAVYPSYNVTGAGGARWNWYQAAQQGAQTKLISPVVFNVGSWTSLSTLGVTFFDTAFRIEGTSVCDPSDLPWLDLPVIEGVTDPGETSLVDVTFDSTGLALGTYTGQLCVYTNDPVNAVHLVDVELVVALDNFLQYLPIVVK